MLKLARALTVLFCALVAVAALFMTAVFLGNDGAPPAFAGAAMTWGVAALLLAAGILAYRRLTVAERRRFEEALASAKTQARLEADGRPIQQGLLFAFLLLLFGFGAWAGVKEGRWEMAALCASLLALFVVLAADLVRQLLRPGPMLAMDLRGIDHAMFGLIRWQDVIGIALNSTTVRGATVHTLQLGVRQPHRFLAQASWMLRLSKRAWLRHRPAFGAIAIPLNPLDKPAELIHQAALSLRGRDPSPFLPHWHALMSDQQVATFLSAHELTQQLASAPATAAPMQLEPILQRMASLQPQLKSAFREDVARIRGTRTKLYLIIAVLLGLLALKLLAIFMR